MYAVNGPSKAPVQGFIIPYNTRQISSVFKPTGSTPFGNPHDVSVTPDGNDIYVVEISQPYKVWKFSRGKRSGKGEQVGTPEDSKTNANIAQPSIPSKPAPLLEDPSTKTQPLNNEAFSPSVIIMAFLTIPLLVLITIGAMFRLLKTGKSVCQYDSSPIQKSECGRYFKLQDGAEEEKIRKVFPNFSLLVQDLKSYV